MFGRQAVVDGNNDELTFIGQFSAHHVVRIEIADHPAAAVEKYQAGGETVGVAEFQRRVDPRRDRPGGRGNRERLNRFEFGRFRIGDETGLQIKFARLGGRSRFVSWPAGFLKCLEHKGGIGIEGHGHDQKPLILRLSFRGAAKTRTRNLEIPRCAIAHLWSGPSDHPGMTMINRRFVRHRRCRRSRRHSLLRRRRGTRRWTRLPKPVRAGARESAL
jgi:hypothetical protein